MKTVKTILVSFAAFYIGCGEQDCTPKINEPPVRSHDHRKPVDDNEPSKSRIVYRDSGGRQLTREELAGWRGRGTWARVEETAVPAEAQELHAKARQAGSSGDYDKALLLLKKAGHLAPDWPYPIYDAAFTYLLKGDAERAVQHYELVVKMAPRGFFSALTAVDSLHREQKGELQEGTYLDFVILQSVTDREARKAALEALLQRSPEFPPAWKELAYLLDDETAKLAAIEKGLSYQPDRTTAGFLLINKSAILNRLGRHSEAVRILRDLTLDPNTPLTVEEFAKTQLEQDFRLDPPE